MPPIRSASIARRRTRSRRTTPIRAEQKAYDNGKADLFPKYTGKGTAGGAGAFGTKGQVMGYFDGNTVTAMWNYAQNFAMSDNAYTDTYGPSTPGAINVISGQTNGVKYIVGSFAVQRHQRRPGRPDADRRHRSRFRRLLEHHERGDPDRQEHRRPAQRRGSHLGLVHGRLQSAGHQRQRHHRLQALAPSEPSSTAASPTTFRTTPGSSTTSRPRTRRMRGRARSRRSVTPSTTARSIPPITAMICRTSTMR